MPFSLLIIDNLQKLELVNLCIYEFIKFNKNIYILNCTILRIVITLIVYVKIESKSNIFTLLSERLT